jgi:hypothetical protein
MHAGFSKKRVQLRLLDGSQSTSMRPPLDPFGSKGGDTLDYWGGGGGPSSDEGTDTLVLCMYTIL